MSIIRVEEQAKQEAGSLLHASFLLSLLFNHEDGGDIFLQHSC
jgi:hypothetical protein